MNVLSLFDGIGCGRVALTRAGVQINQYFSSEIDPYAIKIASKNSPAYCNLGDVRDVAQLVESGALGQIDLLIGGSPCQGFSYAGKQLAFNDPRSTLFFEFVKILNILKQQNPNLKFMLENVKMKEEHKNIITSMLGVQPVRINSALVSAQNRVRDYWCNWTVSQPADRGIVLRDILEDTGDGLIKDHGEMKLRNDKAMCLDANYHKGADNHGQRTMVFVAGLDKGLRLDDGKKLSRNYREGSRIYSPEGKAATLTAQAKGGEGGYTGLYGESAISYRKLTPIECERLQGLPDDYTAGGSNTRRYCALGNGWQVDTVEHIFREMQR